MTKDLPSQLWQPRSTEDTLKLYADWADSYEADVAAYGYATPARCADILAAHMPDLTLPVLDFGCGTGLSGTALAAKGFSTLDGTDISDDMRAQATEKGVYRDVFAGIPGEMPKVAPGSYHAIAAVGVISLGAAPAETLDPLLKLLAPGGLLVFSYNDATLRDTGYMGALADVQTSEIALMLAASYGPHLPQKEGAQGSTVYIMRRL